MSRLVRRRRWNVVRSVRVTRSAEKRVPQSRVFEIVAALTGQGAPRRIPFALAHALGRFEELRAAVLGEVTPLVTRGAVDIFLGATGRSTAPTIRELDYRIRTAQRRHPAHGGVDPRTRPAWPEGRGRMTGHSERARQWVHIGSVAFAFLLRLLNWWQAAAMAIAASCSSSTC